jgi:hypothetical protein
MRTRTAHNQNNPRAFYSEVGEPRTARNHQYRFTIRGRCLTNWHHWNAYPPWSIQQLPVSHLPPTDTYPVTGNGPHVENPANLQVAATRVCNSRARTAGSRQALNWAACSSFDGMSLSRRAPGAAKVHSFTKTSLDRSWYYRAIYSHILIYQMSSFLSAF